MKETDGWVKIKKYTDDGKPVCGDCNRGLATSPRCFIVEGNRYVPGPTCPIWYGEGKSEEEPLPPDLDYYTAVAETQSNPEILKEELLDLIKEVRAWNTRPDSKPYKWKDVNEFFLTSKNPERHYPDVIFNAAREHKEG